jgi:hypothetical protein
MSTLGFGFIANAEKQSFSTIGGLYAVSFYAIFISRYLKFEFF